MDFNNQEQEILANMIKNKKAKKRSSRTRRRSSNKIELHKTSNGDVMLPISDHGESKFGESIATAMTELDSPYLMSDTQSVASQSVASLQPQEVASKTLPSIKPLRRRLSREEQQSFAFGESTGDFSEDDSFGSIEDAHFPEYSVAPSVAPSGAPGNKPAMNATRFAYDRASSRRSLQSVEEGAELPIHRLGLSPPQENNALGSMLSQQNVPRYNSGDEASAEMSIDPMAVFDKSGKRASRKKDPAHDFAASSLTMDTLIRKPLPPPADAASPDPIAEKKKKKKEKKEKKKRKKEKKANAIASAIAAKSPSSVFMESADDILKRWNTKIQELEDEAESLAPEEQQTKNKNKKHKQKAPRLRDASCGELNLASGLMLHDASTGSCGISVSDPSKRRGMTRHMSMTHLSSSPANSPLSGDEQDAKKQQRASSTTRRRPSLTTLFEWNREPSVSNLSAAASAADPPREDESLLVMNVSTVPDRRKSLRRSLSTTDVSHYNKTASWPARRGSASRGMHNLHAQFYRRSTNLPTPAQSNCRSTESSPVITSEQMLQVMEPVTMREVMEFKGLGGSNHRQDNARQKKLVNYGDILDGQSVSSSIASSSARRF